MGEPSGPAAQAEGFDPATGRPLTVATPVPRLGLSAAPVQQGRLIAVLGGSSGTGLPGEVLLFAYEGGTFVLSGQGPRLCEPRREAALVPWPQGRLLLIGGSGTPEEPELDTRELATSEVIEVEGTPRVSEGAQVVARLQPCAAALGMGGCWWPEAGASLAPGERWSCSFPSRREPPCRWG